MESDTESTQVLEPRPPSIPYAERSLSSNGPSARIQRSIAYALSISGLAECSGCNSLETLASKKHGLCYDCVVETLKDAGVYHRDTT